MACRMFGAKPLSEQYWLIANWTLRNIFQWNFNQNTNVFIPEDAFEKWKMAVILSRPRVLNIFLTRPAVTNAVNKIDI